VSLSAAILSTNPVSVEFNVLSNGVDGLSMISARFKDERKRLGLSQEKAAKSLGVSISSLYTYEKGKVSPPASVLLPFADLGADVQYIVTGEHSSSKLSEEDQQLIFAFHAATPSVRSAMLAMLRAGSEKSASSTTQIFSGSVGQVVEGNISAKQTFKFGK
jgi:transcriptional regulator with XRE-family HTH domain